MRTRAWRAWAVALVVGALGLWQFHYAIFASGFELFPGDRGDARAYVYIAEHWYQVLRGQGELLSPRMFYPVKGTLAYTDSFVSHALPSALLRAAGIDMFSAVAMSIVLLNFLTYLTAFLLLHRGLRFNALASAVGALFFAFNSPKQNHPGHFTSQAALFLPLVFMAVVHVGQSAATLRPKRAFGLLTAAALCLTVQFYTSLRLAWFFVFWSVLFLALALLVPASRGFVLAIVKRFRFAVIGSLVVLCVALLPLVLVYSRSSSTIDASGTRPYEQVRRLIPELSSLLRMGDRNYVWGDASKAIWRVHPLPSTEHNIGIGLVPSVAWLALSIVAIWLVPRYARAGIAPGRDEAADRGMKYVALGIVILATTAVYLIGMTYWNGGSPWRVVYLVFPGAQWLRTVARYVLFLALPMAIAFAFVIHRAMQKIAALRRRRARAWATAGLLLVLGFGVTEQFGRAPAFSATAERAWLNKLTARLPDGCAAFYVVAGPVRTEAKYEYQIDAMLVSVMRHVPTLNGYSGHRPRGWTLREVEAPDYENNVRNWIERHRLIGTICRLEVGD